MALLLGACRSPFGDQADVSYCDAVAELQGRWHQAREVERERDVDALAAAHDRIEEQHRVLADVAPAEAKQGWEALAAPGNAGTAGEAAIRQADEDCGSDLQKAIDGSGP